MWKKLVATGLCAAALALPVRAEVNVVNMSKQFGLPYLPMMVIEAQQLIEKNAKAMGLGDVKTTWTQRAGPARWVQVVLTSPRPAALAFFSISCCASMTIIGK